MKTFIFLIAAGLISFSSCKKDKMIPPTIDFKTGTGYISSDGHLAQVTDFTVGVDAKRSEKNDDLKTFIVTVSYDGGNESTVNNDVPTSAEAGEYSHDYNFTTRAQNGTEKFSFTVTNRDGLITTKSITITVP